LFYAACALGEFPFSLPEQLGHLSNAHAILPGVGNEGMSVRVRDKTLQPTLSELKVPGVLRFSAERFRKMRRNLITSPPSS
jgi:hypothetical protein